MSELPGTGIEPVPPDNLESFPLRELWRLTNRAHPVDVAAVRAASLVLFVFYLVISIIRHVPDQPALLWLRAAVLLPAAAGIVLAPRFSWTAVRAYTVAIALLLPSTTVVIEMMHGNHPAELALTALAVFAPTCFLVTAADVLIVSAVLAAATAASITTISPVGVPTSVTGIVIAGALMAGVATALVLISFRNRISESTSWWQQACARERSLREFMELAAPQLGDEVLTTEFAGRFRHVFGAGHCAIVLLDRDAGVPQVAATAGIPPLTSEHASIATPEALGALLAEMHEHQPLIGAPLSIDDVERRFAGLPWLTPGGTLVVLPIAGEESVAGAVVLTTAGMRPIAPEQLLLWKAMANQVGVAVSSARLFSRLQQALRGRSEFVNTMSHELRSPLHVILGYAEMLADGRGEPAFIAARVRASGLELLQLVENTLAAARLGSGKLRVHLSEFRFVELIAELRESIGALPEADSGVAVRWESADDLPVVRLDRLKVKEIIHNLVSNALKFSTRGEVVVHIDRDGGQLRVEVDDSGCGIPLEAQARIFEMFERLEAHHGAGGAGLGLYIVKNLVQMLGGTVTLSSEPGRGSRFTVWLPLVAVASD
jgi:signal transduction histidine kinase